MMLEVARIALFAKDETLGFAEREAAIDAFLQGDVPPGQAERYVAALEAVLARLSTPIETGDVLLGRMVEGPIPYEMEHVPAGGLSHVHNPFRQEGRNGGHMSLDYAPLLKKGLSGIVEEMETRAQTTTQRRYAALARRAACAIRDFAARYAKAARAAGDERAARALETVPYRPAYDFFSALQAVWMVEMMLSCVTGARDYAYSRLDLALLPYFQDADRDDALDLLVAFFVKNNEIGGMGSELHQPMPVPCAATNIYLMLGGRGATDALELDLLFLQAAKMALLPQPVLALRVEKASPEAWKLACADASQTLNGQAALYNDDALIDNLVKLGYTEEQALHYTMSGCNRAEFTGHQSCDVFHNVPQWLLEAFYDENVRNMDGLLAAFDAVMRRELRQYEKAPRVDAEAELRFHLESLLLHGCTDKVCDIENGGLSVETMVHNLCGMATVADSLSAIQTLVFDEKALSLEAYRALVKENFVSDPALLARIRGKLPHYGNDDPAADRWATRAGAMAATAVREIGGERVHIPSFYSLYMHHHMGKALGATPDGRLAGEPISENQSPVYGRDTQGVTALLHSASALPQGLCGAGGLNVRFAKKLENRLLSGLVDAYFAMGGVNIAPSVVSRETLLAAREHPEQYGSLCVRIVGYSEVFLRLPESMQNELIERTELAM
jgi:formate C-acetyltransferase